MKHEPFMNSEYKGKILARLQDDKCGQSFKMLVSVFYPKVYEEYTNQLKNNS